jgi:hypothetical protein
MTKLKIRIAGYGKSGLSDEEKCDIDKPIPSS